MKKNTVSQIVQAPPRQEADEALSDLLSGFSSSAARVWLARKFDSYNSSLGRREMPWASMLSTDDDRRTFSGVEPLGFIEGLPSGDGREKPIVVASIGMNRDLTERSSRLRQFALAKRIIQSALTSPVRFPAGRKVESCSQGLFFFHDSRGMFRISLVTCEIKGRSLVSSTARRQSFFCDPGSRNNIVRRRLGIAIRTFDELASAFSVEGITKEFYNRLFAWFQWACDPATGVSFPNRVHDANDDRAKLPEAVIRLITRLMFTWFVRQRGLIPDAIFDGDAVSRLLAPGFSPNASNDSTYYRAILQNLFFATLNRPESDRAFVSDRTYQGKNSGYGVKTLYRFKEAFRSPEKFIALVSGIPFMNCALFDCLDYTFDRERDADEIARNGGETEIFLDGFSRRPTHQAFVPNCLFFYDKPNAEGHEGIIRLFDQYEFTVDENTSDDSDIALDPELLGKVFENLLGAFNPETKEIARKSTGSFYTPREIVDYMSAESLKAYLLAKVPDVSREKLDRLFDRDDTVACTAYLQPTQVDALCKALYGCRMLDPACGSGAFPMGMLLLMTRLFAKLDPQCVSVRREIRARYDGDKGFVNAADWMTDGERAERLAELDARRDSEYRHPDYARKLFIIENCLYGVDIQPIATQISKLRFFISLLCDQLRDNWDETEKRYRFVALPNLEAKFACANTLLSLPSMEGELDLSSGEILRLRQRLAAQRRSYFFARTYARKKEAAEKERQTRREIKAAVKKAVSTPDEGLIRQHAAAISKLERELDAVRAEKWVTMRKPRQADLFGGEPEQGELMVRVDANKDRRDAIVVEIATRRRAIAAERAKATQSQSGSAGDEYAEKVANWNPYDQNASSDFFDPDWMFGIKGGFDIVIGNPPYIRRTQLDVSDKIKYEARYTSAHKQYDLYLLFTELGLSILNHHGFLCYINPIRFFNADYGEKLRGLIITNYSLKMICDVSQLKVFESAMTYPCIMLYGKHADKMTFIKYCKLNCLSQVNSARSINPIMISVDNIRQDTNHRFLTCDNESVGIVQKIEKSSLPLGMLFVSARGLPNSKVNYDGDGYFAIKSKGVRRFFLDDKFVINVSVRNWDEFSNEMVILPRTVKEIHATLKPKKLVILDRIYYLLPRKKVDRKVKLALVGVLNSRAIAFWFENVYSTTKVSGGYFDLNGNQIESIPFPTDRNDSYAIMASLVDRILAAKKADPNADTTALEAEIDRLVYGLYGLTPEEIAVVEGASSKAAAVSSVPSAGDARERKPRRETNPKPVRAEDDDEYLD